MARLFSSGFELNSGTAGVEWTTVTGSPTIQSSVVRSGTYAGQLTSLSSGSKKGWGYQWASTNTAGPIFVRFYFRLTTAPTADNVFFSCVSSTILGQGNVSLKVTSTGTLKLFNSTVQIGSASSALNLNQWYRIEVKYDASAIAGSHILEAMIDGSVFATASNLTVTGSFLSAFGGNLAAEAQTTGNWYFEDIAINDATGSFQTSYPGEGKIIHLRPNAAGDAAAWTKTGTSPQATNWQGVSEVTPDDGTTINTSLTLNQEDLHNIDDPTLISNQDTINLVQVGVRYRGESTTTVSTFKVEIEKTSAGTISQSAAITPNSTSYGTNANAAPRNYPLTLYQDPDAVNWTQSVLTTTQIGYKITTSSTFKVDVSTIWLLVEYQSNQIKRWGVKPQ